MAENFHSDHGTLFLVVGNSGSGKDSVIQGVVKGWPHQFPQVLVPQRVITRPIHESESYHSVSPAKFAAMKTAGDFAFTWHIYGLDYGVPVEIFRWLEQGHLVLVNVSRSIIAKVKQMVPKTEVVFIDVPFEVSKTRIQNREREDPESNEFQARLKRAKKMQHLPEADVVINNAGELSVAISQLGQYLESFV